LCGLTATPCRGDGRGLGGLFQAIIEAPQVPDLIDLGYLVRTRVYAPKHYQPDLKGVRVQAGDYVESQLAALVGDIVTHWLKHGENRKTVVFASSIGHSAHIKERFCEIGVAAEHIDGDTPKPERDATLARLERGQISVVSNCMVLTEGWDMPDIGCCILARPTRQMGLYRQMIGRGLRPASGKRDLIVLDHSGAVYQHGFVEDRVEWTLKPDRRAKNAQQEAREASPASRVIECSQCGSMREGGKACPYCGFLPQTPPKSIVIGAGSLGLVARNGQQPADPALQARWHAMLAQIATERGYKPGWIAHKFREKFGTWPRGSATPCAPSSEVRRWVKSRQIAYAKAKDRERSATS
jgi:DNA repair protein RadD